MGVISTKKVFHLQMTIQIPAVPNYLRYGSDRERSMTVKLGDISDEDLRAIGDEWTKNLIERAHEQRKGNL